MPRYLIVANLTLAGRPLWEAVQERLAEGSCSFHVVVPASHDPRGSWTWTEEEARREAEDRLARALDKLRELGCDAEGEIGDVRAIDAVLDAVRENDYDEIILSTLPPGMSRWLKMDLPSRVERAVSVPVTHVVGEPEPQG